MAAALVEPTFNLVCVALSGFLAVQLLGEWF